jgi:hypothetical protein
VVNQSRGLRRAALVHLHEVLALARLGDEIAELADEARPAGAVHEQALREIARAHHR